MLVRRFAVFSHSSRRLSTGSSGGGLRVFVSESNDAILNLATEEWLFRDADIGQQTLYLWRNDKVRACGGL